jgi:hypothetical protein
MNILPQVRNIRTINLTTSLHFFLCLLLISLGSLLGWTSRTTIPIPSTSKSTTKLAVPTYLVRCQHHPSLNNANSLFKIQELTSGILRNYPSTSLKNQIPVSDDDDGWDGSSPSLVAVGRSANETETRNKDTELTAINDEEIKNSKGIVETNKRKKKSDTDLFIPIFAMVSIMGFAGLYLYETLRLYSEGELYLPWMNN